VRGKLKTSNPKRVVSDCLGKAEQKKKKCKGGEVISKKERRAHRGRSPKKSKDWKPAGTSWNLKERRGSGAGARLNGTAETFQALPTGESWKGGKKKRMGERTLVQNPLNGYKKGKCFYSRW